MKSGLLPTAYCDSLCLEQKRETIFTDDLPQTTILLFIIFAIYTIYFTKILNDA